MGPHGINIGWMGTGQKAEGAEEGEVEDEAGQFKMSPVFPPKTVLGTLKELTFYRKEKFDIKAEYADGNLPSSGTKELGTYSVELPMMAAVEAKEIKVRVRLT